MSMGLKSSTENTVLGVFSRLCDSFAKMMMPRQKHLDEASPRKNLQLPCFAKSLIRIIGSVGSEKSRFANFL